MTRIRGNRTTPQGRDGVLDTLRQFMRPKPQAQEPIALHAGGQYVAPSRRSKKAVTTWQDQAAVKQLKDLANALGISQQQAIAEALNLWFARHGKPTIAS